MKTQTARSQSKLPWEVMSGRMRVVRMTTPIQILIPALIFPALSSGTRGITFPPGRPGVAIGVVLALAGVLIGGLLLRLGGVVGVVGGLVSFWFLGTAGVATLVGTVKPIAYVKSICVECRLLPVIKEHESIHLTGVGSEDDVWASMRTRHSVTSLALEGDPAICSFCPIPKRLAES